MVAHRQAPEKVVELKAKETVPPHAKIPHEDLDWVLNQPPTVLRLFVESWRCDSFGSQSSKGNPHWHELKTNVRGSNLRVAMSSLKKANLFEYEPVFEVGIRGQRKIAGWKCWNLHGYCSNYWKPVGESDKPVGESDKPVGESDKLVGESDKLQPETQSEQAVQKTLLLLNNSSITHQQPTKVVGGVVLGSIPTEETEESPLGGAPPTMPVGMSEEEPPQAAEVASLATARELWADSSMRTRISQEIADHPEWNLAVVDGEIQEPPF